MEDDDLGFTCQRTKEGCSVFHHGRFAATLRGAAASRLEAALADTDSAKQQRLMAKLTGNYKRGNERRARKHPRNRT